MPFLPLDRQLLQRCFQHDPGAWNDFVDRFIGLIYHSIHYTAYLRSAQLKPEDVEDLAAEVLLQIVANDYAVLRTFRGESSLSAYLTVITRRICVHEMSRKFTPGGVRVDSKAIEQQPDHRPQPVGIEGLEQVERILRRLPAREREVVRLFYLEGRSYEEISIELNMPINSIGSVLSRARKRLNDNSDGDAPPTKTKRPKV